MSLATCLLLCLAFVSSAFSGDVDIEHYPQYLEEHIPLWLEQAKVPGFSVAVIANGKAVWAKGFGHLSGDSGAEVDTHTMFEAASLSKNVFAYLVIKWVHEGRLELDAPLVSYVDEGELYTDYFRVEKPDERIRQITVRQILSHSSGMPPWRGDSDNPIHLQANPGTTWIYSGEGYMLLQWVMEHMAGKSLEQLMQEEVFGPLGMKRSTYKLPDSLENVVTRHDFAGVPKPLEDSSVKAPTSLLTTAQDYARLIEAMLGAEQLSESLVESMLARQIKRNMEGTDDAVYWALGFGLHGADNKDKIVLWQWGDRGSNLSGSKGFFALDVESGNGVVFLGNSPNGLSFAREMLSPLFGEDWGMFETRPLTVYQHFRHPGFRIYIKAMKGIDAIFAEIDAVLKEHPGDTPPFEPALLINLAQEVAERFELQQAVPLLKRNAELFPQEARPWFVLGRVYQMTGKPDMARDCYRHVAEIDPDYKNLDKALESLQEK